MTIASHVARYHAAWSAAWQALGVRAGDRTLLPDLVQRYLEPHRHYHTLQHLDECFEKLHLLRESADHPAEIEIALWFHDAVYDMRRQDNEQRSAQWAADCVAARGASAASIERVRRLVMATRHSACPETTDETILVDVDLAILGASVERFDEYERQVRDEYEWVPEPVFRDKRRSVLAGFLAREHIFGTPLFASLLEAPARENLARSLARLEA